MNTVLKNNERWRYLDRALEEGVRQRGFRVGNGFSSNRHVSGSDFAVLPIRDSSHQVFVARRVEGVYRSDRFQDLIGHAILRFQALSVTTSEHAQLLLAIYLDRYSPRAIADLAEYSDQYLDGALNWMVVSSDGRAIIRLFGVDAEYEMDHKFASPSASRAEPSRYSLFSERHQWLFKCLLLPGMSPSYWGGPPQRARSVVELAERSGIPQPSVSIFLQQSEAAGYIKRERRLFRVVRHRELLEEWSFAPKYNPPESINVRPIYGDQSFEEWMSQHAIRNSRPSFVASSHLACNIMRLGRSNNPDKVVYVQDDFKEIMARFDLLYDPSGSPWGRLIRPKYPELIFRGAVLRENVWIADILQVYLDVRHSPARGMEQAEVLYMSQLHKHFERS